MLLRFVIGLVACCTWASVEPVREMSETLVQVSFDDACDVGNDSVERDEEDSEHQRLHFITKPASSIQYPRGPIC